MAAFIFLFATADQKQIGSIVVVNSQRMLNTWQDCIAPRKCSAFATSCHCSNPCRITPQIVKQAKDELEVAE